MGPGWKRLIIAAFLGLTFGVSGLVASGAQAITRAQATRVALRILQPSRAGGAVVVFGLPTPVRKGSDVVEAGPGVFSGHHVAYRHRGFDTFRVLRLRAPRLQGPAWLFWEDLAPGALFAHPSVLLLLDARSGRVVMFKRLAWAPVVDGRRAVFLRSVAGYSSSRYRVFVSAAARARSDGASSNARRAATSVRSPRAGAALAPNLNLKGVCIVAAGATDDVALFSGDFKAVSDMASALGVKFGKAGTVPELSQTISRAESIGCNHIVLFLMGHGAAPKDPWAEGNSGLLGTVFPCIEFKGPDNGHVGSYGSLKDIWDRGTRLLSTEELCVNQLKGILDGHPGTKFDVQIWSCYGGRFVPPLTELPNVASVGAAAGPNRVGYGNTHGGPSDFTASVVNAVLSWAKDPKAVSETGGNITSALEDGDRSYGALHLDREPEVYDSVHGEILKYDQAHPQGQYVPSTPIAPKRGYFVGLRVEGVVNKLGGWGAGSVSGPGNSGSVTEGRVSVEHGAVGPFPAGTSIVLTALPARGSHFDHWEGSCAGSNSTCTLTSKAGLDVTAFFAQDIWTVTVVNQNPTGGSAYGVSWLDCGDGRTICSAPAPGQASDMSQVGVTLASTQGHTVADPQGCDRMVKFAPYKIFCYLNMTSDRTVIVNFN